MIHVIYKKSNLVIVGVIASDMTVKQEIELNVIPNFGGVIDDYAVIETDKNNFHLELIDGVVTIIENIIPPMQSQPTAEDYLLDLDYRVSKIELGV